MGSGYPDNWDRKRKRVYQRDNHRCQNCGRKGGPKGNAELHAHHIVPKSKGGTHKLSNLKTLCSKCHSRVHGRPVGSQQKKKTKRSTKKINRNRYNTNTNTNTKTKNRKTKEIDFENSGEIDWEKILTKRGIINITLGLFCLLGIWITLRIMSAYNVPPAGVVLGTLISLVLIFSSIAGLFSNIKIKKLSLYICINSLLFPITIRLLYNYYILDIKSARQGFIISVIFLLLFSFLAFYQYLDLKDENFISLLSKLSLSKGKK